MIGFLACMASASPVIYDGDLIILTSNNNTLTSNYWLKVDDTKIRPLSITFNPMEAGLQTGVAVRVYSSLMPSGTDAPIYADRIEEVAKMLPKKDVPNYDITSITFHFGTVCNAKNININMMKSAWFKNRDWNMRSYHENCSFGTAKFEVAKNIVIGPITIPCTGKSSYGNFDSEICDSKFIFGLMSIGEAFAKSKGIDISKHSRRIASLPQIPACKWAGLGSIGCGSYCYAWIQNDKDVILSTYFHELGHNLGLMHSSFNGVEYGDGGCAMGMSSRVACFNAAHNWILGWNELLKDYNKTNYPIGTWDVHNIPSSQVNRTNVIRITPDWSDAYSYQKEVLYISYLTPTGYDTLLLPSYVNTMQVHSSKNIYLPEYANTHLLYSGNGTYDIPFYNLVVSVLYLKTHSAIIKMCVRKSLVESNCMDGMDDDCDGLIDKLDDDCQERFFCGDGFCRGQETAQSCPTDCAMVCGDGFCDPRGETRITCPRDCCVKKSRCGDKVCDAWAGEHCKNCPTDCMGDGLHFCCGSVMGCSHNMCSSCNEMCI